MAERDRKSVRTKAQGYYEWDSDIVSAAIRTAGQILQGAEGLTVEEAGTLAGKVARDILDELGKGGRVIA